MSAVAPDAYSEAARALAAWDRTPESALRLRELARSLPSVRGQLDDDRARVLQRVQGCSASGKTLAAKTVSATPAAYGPFLGDPALGEWPFHDPLHVEDDEA